MKSSFRFGAAAALLAATLVGCDWGGVSSEESWNDAYAWANFSGTYKLVTEIVPESGEEGGGTNLQEIENVNKISNVSGQRLSPVGDGIVSVQISCKTWYIDSSAISAQNPEGKVGPILVSFVSVGDNDVNITLKPKAGQADVPVCTVDKKSGAIDFTLGSNYHLIEATVTYVYKTAVPVSAGAIGSGTVDAPAPITWLNVTQKGNLLTLQDNDGRTYSGKITGASCPDADAGGYVVAGHIRFSFEATCTANSAITISGSLSGDWSGAQNETSGIINNRTMDASFSNGGSPTQFQAVSGSVTVVARTVTPVAGAY